MLQETYIQYELKCQNAIKRTIPYGVINPTSHNLRTTKMLDVLCSGKLIRDPQLKTAKTGTAYCQFLLSALTGEQENAVISGVAFGDVAEKIGRLTKGDSLAVIGSLKPSSWNDKATGELKHGLEIKVSNSLSLFDIKNRRAENNQPPAQSPHNEAKANGYAPQHDSPPYHHGHQ